jgi:hypothetical protein
MLACGIKFHLFLNFIILHKMTCDFTCKLWNFSICNVQNVGDFSVGAVLYYLRLPYKDISFNEHNCPLTFKSLHHTLVMAILSCYTIPENSIQNMLTAQTWQSVSILSHLSISVVCQSCHIKYFHNIKSNNSRISHYIL